MSEATFAVLARFDGSWRARLSEGGRFECVWGELPEEGLTPAQKADAFVQQHGFKSIGFNWEMLDPEAPLDGSRSAFGTIVEALQHDIAQPGQRWLSQAEAHLCARQFLDAFAPTTPTVLTNHLNGLWWPISDAADEWSFVAMDDRSIVLWLMAR